MTFSTSLGNTLKPPVTIMSFYDRLCARSPGEVNPTSRIAATAIDNDACIDTRRLLSDLSRPQQNRRFLFLGNYVSTLLAQRETLLLDAVQSHPTWASPTTLDDIVCTAAALLAAPTSD